MSLMFPTIYGPWLLVDYRSSGRMHPVYQKGYNRKGLILEKGKKKKSLVRCERIFWIQMIKTLTF